MNIEKRFEKYIIFFSAIIVFQAAFSDISFAQETQSSLNRRAILELATNAESPGIDFTTAIEFYQQASAQAGSAGDYLAKASILNRVGILYDHEGQYQRALGFFENGLKILETRGTGKTENIVGNALVGLRSMGKGFQSGGGNPVVTDLYRGEIADLVAFLDRDTLAIQKELAVMLLTNAGNMYLQQSQFSQADSLYHQARQMARQTGLISSEKQITANMAWGLIKNNKLDEARTLLDSIVTTGKETNLQVEMRRAFLARGVALRGQEMYAEALLNVKKAMMLYESAGDARGYCRALAQLGTTYFENGDFQHAKQNYLAALAKNVSVNDKETAWHANGGLAKCYAELGEDQKALAHFQKYWEIVSDLGGNFTTDQGKVSFLENQTKLLEEYARVALKVSISAHDFKIAGPVIEKLRGSSFAALLKTRLNRKAPVAGTLPEDYLIRLGHPRFAENIAGDLPPNKNDAFNPVAQMAVGVESNLIFPGTPSLSEVRQTAEDVSSIPDRFDVVDIPDSMTLPPATFLEYYVLDDQVAVLVQAPNREISGTVIPLSADSLDKLIAEYRFALKVQKPRGIDVSRNAVVLTKLSGQPHPRSVGLLSRQLYELLIAPVAKLLPGESREPVVIVPHRSLWLIPFAALPDSQGRYFGEQFALTYAPSKSDLSLIAAQPRTADHRNARAWIVGNPRMPENVNACNLDVSFSPLPGAKAEAVAIAGLFGKGKAELFTGAQADRLRLEAWHPAFSVLHFATHGFACMDDPLGSFIVLSQLDSSETETHPKSEALFLAADNRFPVTPIENPLEINIRPRIPDQSGFSFPGILDARTIINRFYLTADLVTLSACQTGLGKVLGQGTIGFTRAFLAAGARSLLVSLWQVDDKSTKELMISFYREYLRHGNKALALQNAMLETRKQYPNPKDWAAFTLIGMAE